METRAPRVKTERNTLAREMRGIGAVALRFEVYTAAEPEFDIYAEIYKRLGLMGRELIVDVGAHDGSFIFWLEGRHDGDLIGIEPQRSVIPNIKNGRHVRFYEYLAQNLPGNDNTVDVLTANFMMYFVPEDEQLAVLHEFKRVVKNPFGKIVISTSGAANKSKHREFEESLAEYLGVEAPERMNKTFDSEKALLVLPTVFTNVYHVSYRGKMVFRDEVEAIKYYHSIMSMKDVFTPAVGEGLLHDAYMKIVMPVIRRDLSQFGQFEDPIERDFFICNDNSSLGLGVHDPGSDYPIIVRGYMKENSAILPARN